MVCVVDANGCVVGLFTEEDATVSNIRACADNNSED